MKTAWLVLSLVGLSLSASLGDIEPSSLIGRRELRRPALLLEAQRLNHGAAARRQGVHFKTLSNFGGRRRLSAPPGSDVALPTDASSIESGSDDAVASLISRFGGVIQQKRRLGDDDAVLEDGDDIIAHPSSTKEPLTSIGGAGKASESDAPAWMPTYGGTYRAEPQLQSNYKALLSEPEFGPSVPPTDSYAAVVGSGTVSAEVGGPASGTSGRKELGPSEESMKADGQPTGKKGDSKDCKDKNVKDASKFGTGAPGEVAGVATGVAAKTEMADKQPLSTKESSAAEKHPSTPDDIEYEDDDDDYEDDKEHQESSVASKNEGSPSSHEDKTAPSSITGAVNAGSDSSLPSNVNESGEINAGFRQAEVGGSTPSTGISSAATLGAVQGNTAAIPSSESVEDAAVRVETLGQNLDERSTIQLSPAAGPALSSGVGQATQPVELAQANSPTQEGLSQSSPLPVKGASVSAGSAAETGQDSPGTKDQNAGASSAPVNVERGSDDAPQVTLPFDSTSSQDDILLVGKPIAATITEVPVGNDDDEEPHTNSESRTLHADSSQDNTGSATNATTEDVSAGKSPEDPTDDVSGTEAELDKSISNVQSERVSSQEGQSGIPQGQEGLKEAIAPVETVSSLPNQGREQPVMNGISREAAEREILILLKQRASKQDATVKAISSQEFPTVRENISGQEEALTSTSGGGVNASLNSQHNAPTLLRQNVATVLKHPAPSINERGQPLLPESGLSSQPANGALPGSQIFHPDAVQGTSIPGYAIPLDPGLYYPYSVSGSHDASGSVFGQGSFPVDTAGFVAETPPVVPPSVTNETNATVSAAQSANDSETNSSSKSAGQSAAAEEPEKNSNDLGSYNPASSLASPMTGKQETDTTPSVEDDASTSFVAGTDSLSTEKEKKLAVTDLEGSAAGSMGKAGFPGISINVTDTQTPIDVSGIVRTPGDRVSSVPSRSKPSTTITDSTKTVVVEGGSSDMPIDVSGIATSSETPSDDKEAPNEAPKLPEAGNDSLKPVQNETGLPSVNSAGGAKTKDDCENNDTSSTSDKSPHGRPVVFGEASDPTSTLQDTDKRIQASVITGVGGAAVPDSVAIGVQNDAPANQSVVNDPGQQLTLNAGEKALKGTDSQTSNGSHGTGIGYVIGTKLTFNVDENGKPTTSSTPQPTTETSTVSSAKIETTDDSPISSITAISGDVTTPSAQAASDQQDDRELGGADTPEPPERKLDEPSEKSIAAVVNDMMSSNETSKVQSPLSDRGDEVLKVTAKYTPLPTSSVSISPVGPSTATLPALGYATVREIQIASQPALDPKKSSISSLGNVSSAEKGDSMPQKMIQVVEGVGTEDSAPATPSPPEVVNFETTSTPITEVSTAAKDANHDAGDMKPENMNNESLSSQGLLTETLPPTSTTNATEATEMGSEAPTVSPATEAPFLAAISESSTAQPHLEKSAPGLLDVSTETSLAFTEAVAVQSLNESSPALGALAPEIPSTETSTSVAVDQSLFEGQPLSHGSSTQAPLVTSGESLAQGTVASQGGFVNNGPSTRTPSSTSTTSAAIGPTVRDSTAAPLSSPTEASTPSTSVDMTTETTVGSTLFPTGSTTEVPHTTENPDVATVPIVTEITTTAAPSTTQRITTPSTTIKEIGTLPPVELPRRPQIKPLGGAKRPLFNVARPPSFAATVAQRRFKPVDRVHNEGVEVTPPTTTQAPLLSTTLSVGNKVHAEDKEDTGVRVVEGLGIQFRRPHFPRPVSADRRVIPGGKLPGRNAGRRRKPGSRGGHRRTTTTPRPPQDMTATPSTEGIEATSPGQPVTSPFGARIGARVPQTSGRPTTQQSFNTDQPVIAERPHRRPAKPRRTKRPKLPAATRPPVTDSNDVRYAYTPVFASTRIPEAAYETTHEAYITEIAPASATYRTKSPLVAEVTLPSTEDERNSVSSVDYDDEPLSDEPDLPATSESGSEPPMLPRNRPSQAESYDQRLLQEDHGQSADNAGAQKAQQRSEIPAKADISTSQYYEEPAALDKEDTEQTETPTNTAVPALSTLASTPAYGGKTAVSTNSASESPNDLSKSVSEGVDIGVNFYPTRYHPHHTTKGPTTLALTEAPTDPFATTSSSQPSSPASQSEEFLPSTPEVDISRIPTTPAPKPAQTTTLPTTKKMLYPPLPEPPAKPVAVFLEGLPGKEQSNVPEVKAPTHAEKNVHPAHSATPTSSTGSSLITAQTEPPQVPQVPQGSQFTLAKRPEVDIPPSYLIPNAPNQAQGQTYRPTQQHVHVSQSSASPTKASPTVTRPPSNAPSTAGMTITVPSQQSAVVSSTAQAHNLQTQTTVRSQSGSAAGYAQQGPGSVELSVPSLGGSQLSANGDRLPSAFAPSESTPPRQQHNPSSSYPSRPLAQQPSAGSIPPIATITAAPKAPTSPQAPASPSYTKFPISTTSRPRVSPSYVPQPAYLQPLGLQVQPFIIPNEPKQQPAQQGQPQVGYAQPLGLQVSSYQPVRLQKPAAPTSQRETLGLKAQTQGAHAAQFPQNRQKPLTAGRPTAANRPALDGRIPVQQQSGQAQRPSSVTAQEQPTQPGYILPLGLQVAYIPPIQGHPGNAFTGSQGAPLSVPLPPEAKPVAAVKPPAPKRPQYAVVRAQQQVPTSDQVVQRQSAGAPKPVSPQRVVYQATKATGANGQAPRASVQAQSFGAAPNVPLRAPNRPKVPSAFLSPQINTQPRTVPSTQQPRPLSQPQFQPVQKPHIGQAHTRIYFSPPVPQKQNGLKQPPLPASPFFLSIRHDKVVQEDIPFPHIDKVFKQMIPADIVLPPQKPSSSGKPSASSKAPGSASETLLQIPQTPRPARVQAQKAVPTNPTASGKKPASPAYYTPAGQHAVVRQVILSPATGPIPYQPQTLVSESPAAPQQGTQGVYKVSTYVPVASASLPGRPGVTATSYVPTTRDGQVLKVTSVAKPGYHSPNQAVVQTTVQGTRVGTNAASVSPRQPGAVPSTKQQTAPSAANTVQGQPVQGQPVPGTQAFVRQGLAQAQQQQVVQVTSYVPQARSQPQQAQAAVQVPQQQQQVVQVTSYAPRGTTQAHQAQGGYLSQLPVHQPYPRGQEPSLNFQVPIVYASAPQAPPQIQYYPGAAGVTGHLKQYPQQQYQTVYALPNGQITLAQLGSRTQGATQGASHRIYFARGSSVLQQGTSSNTGAQRFAPIVYQRPPVTLLERRPVFGYQPPVYVAASPHQLSQGAAKIAGGVSPFRQPLGLSIG